MAHEGQDREERSCLQDGHDEVGEGNSCHEAGHARKHPQHELGRKKDHAEQHGIHESGWPLGLGSGRGDGLFCR